MIQEAIAKNPQLQNAMQIMRMNNMSMQQFAMMFAQQQGIDINELIKELQS